MGNIPAEPVMPEGCVCPPESWGEPIEAICNEFEDWDSAPCCVNCGHEKACHERP